MGPGTDSMLLIYSFETSVMYFQIRNKEPVPLSRFSVPNYYMLLTYLQRSTFHFSMVMFLVRLPMMFIFLNLFDLFECPAMLMTLIYVKGFGSKPSQTRI